MTSSTAPTTSSSSTAPKKPPPNMSVEAAVEGDIPTMAEINFEAYNSDGMFQVGFVNWPDEEHMRPFFLGRVKGRFEIPGTVMYKAVNDAGRIEGFIGLTEETEEKKPEAPTNGQSKEEANGDVKVGEEAIVRTNGSESTSPPINGTNGTNGANDSGTNNIPAEYDENGRLKFNPDEIRKKTGTGQYFKTQDDGKMVLPAYLNQDLMLGVRDVVRPMMEHIADQGKHYYISAFAVRPECQGRGIGSLLLSRCISVVKANPAKLPIWLVALPGSHALCLKHGFSDVHHVDMDLDKYDKQNRGLGVYRQWSMKQEVQ